MALTSTRERILAAAFDCVARSGLGGLALEEVASAADVSRQTVYRHFGSREGLIEALVMREEQWFIDCVVSAAEGHAEASSAIVAGVTAALDAATEHPLLRRLLENEPGLVLPLVVLGQGPVISAARPVVAELLRSRLALPAPQIQAMADVGSRLLVSYVLDPGDEGPQLIGRRISALVLGMASEAKGESFAP